MNREEGAPPAPLRGDRGESGAPVLATFAIIAAAALFLYLVRNILLPFVLGGIVAYVCSPLVAPLSELGRLPRWASAVAIVVGLMAVVAVLGLLAGPGAGNELARLATNFHGSVEDLTRQLIGNQSVNVLGEPLDARR